MENTEDVTGYSSKGIKEAIKNALQKAGKHTRFEVIETLGSQDKDDKRSYQVVLKTYND